MIDHGKAFLSAHVISVCTRLGISIQPAQPKKPTDKPTCERFFKTLREGLIQHLPAYKGPDIYSRGEHVEDAAFLFIHELEDVIREWIALVYHRSRQDGLAVPEWPHLKLSPNEMYETGIARAGLLRIPATPELAYDFLRGASGGPSSITASRWAGCATTARRWMPTATPRAPTAACTPASGRSGSTPTTSATSISRTRPTIRWHRLEWEHAPGLGTPFSGEAARYARQLAARQDRWPDAGQALGELLARWDQGMVTGRRERRMAVRLAAERAALPDPAACRRSQVACLPGTHAPAPAAARGTALQRSRSAR